MPPLLFLNMVEPGSINQYEILLTSFCLRTRKTVTKVRQCLDIASMLAVAYLAYYKHLQQTCLRYWPNWWFVSFV